MIPDHLPPLAASLRTLGAYAERHELHDGTLGEIADELRRGLDLASAAQGRARANACLRHPGGPVDPTADNGCLLCGDTGRRPATPSPQDVTPLQVLCFAREHGDEAAARTYGARALARELAMGTRNPAAVLDCVPGGPEEAP
ncbi:hypothetical protein ACIRST_39085 [Kitasatospora sp. NPDC101447]|uniref:hypothetical protein n=1 Tax=Kitasatospora sp. NPDC101447 TaxID=3364102 RepID=UPI00380CD846